MFRITAAVLVSLTITSGIWLLAEESVGPDTRKSAEKLLKDGNYKEALDLLRKLALNKGTDAKLVGKDMQQALRCYRSLGRDAEIDAFRDEFTKLHAENWRALGEAAQSHIGGERHYGYIVAGKFERGNRRSSRGARYVNSYERDRVRALQLFGQAVELFEDGESQEQGNLLLNYAFAVKFMRDGYNSWRLQSLTDTEKLPDYESGYGYGYGYRYGYSAARGAPVDEDGNPVYYGIPESFEKAANDGERWRWLLNLATQKNDSLKPQIDYDIASFFQQQFGVQTMGGYLRPHAATEKADGELDEKTGPFSVSTLKENETIARLATGVKRFEIPDEFNFIKLYQALAKSGKSVYQRNALHSLAGIFENRQQYSKAAGYWRESLEAYGDKYGQGDRLDQIEGNWGQFDGAKVQASEKGAELQFQFRNGNNVTFTAFPIDVPKLLADVKEYLKKRPPRIEYQNINIGNIGYKLVYENQEQYLGKKIAEWAVELKPRPNHFNRRVTIKTPLQKAGAYLVEAKMKDGNTSRIIAWLDDTAIIQKRLNGKVMYYVADANSGAPVSKANVEFFGYRQQYIRENKPRATGRYETYFSNFAEKTDDNGMLVPDPQQLTSNYSWVAIARTDTERFAYLGFNGIWYGTTRDSQLDQNKVFTITDRPVYRPDQTVHFKFWVRNARYDKADVSQFAGKSFLVEIKNPKGEKLLAKNFTADEFGGFEGEVELPEDATLGVYSIQIPWDRGLRVGGGNSFRVEEYKKPEFEVSVDAPAEPVKLGDKITATINAKYYFGAPVTNAIVKYKVSRTNHDDKWYPYDRWDWLYGNGYWWFASDATWYPGWYNWGCKRPHPYWWPQRQDPPEIVLENEVPIGPDGTVKVEIDSSIAKELHGDTDHQYSITAEITDESRRTIVGSGNVLAARQPFKIFTWLDRGYYNTGDTATVNIKAQTLDRKPISKPGKLTLFKIDYDEKGNPNETPVESWDLKTDEQGELSHKFKVPVAGQFRIAFEIDSEGGPIEGAYIFLVRGDNLNSADFQFSDLEIIPDKKTYRPGEKVKLLINTNRIGSTVLLFIKPINGIYSMPKMLKLTGKSDVYEVGVAQSDMPNFFIEAVTIANANVHEQVRDVAVPPEKRVLNIEVTSSEQSYQPGQKAEVRLKVTDENGEPYLGTLALTVYDKSVEYISGGSNIQEIREFFWKYRRHHNPSTMSSLARYFGNLLKRNEKGMSNLGVFGHLTAEIEEKQSDKKSNADFGMEGGNRSRKLAKGMAMDAAAAPGMAANEMADAEMDRDGAKNKRRANAQQEGQGQTQFAETNVRTKFADTAFWKGTIETNKNGKAKVSFDMPENLTGWKIKAWGMSHGTRVGQGETEVVTAKNVLVRLQAPRFFVEKDTVFISSNVHNYLKTDKEVRVSIEYNDTLAPMTQVLYKTVTIPAGGEHRADWAVRVMKEGLARITVKAETDEESDAMQMEFPVYVHGMLKTESFTGVIRPDEKLDSLKITVPTERRINQSRLEIRYSPTLAGAMVDALPYLVEFPYGCTEQTLNRFLPTVITQRILLDMNLDLAEIEKKRTNLNAQEIGDDRERAKGWKRWDRNPVFDKAEVDKMVKHGVQRLTEMQLSDGGWGWFSGWGERSYPHTTAVVVHGLQIAVANDIALVPGILEKGVKWLENYRNTQIELLKKGDLVRAGKKIKERYKLNADNLDALVEMVLVDANQPSDTMRGYLYRDRLKLSVYSLAMFGMALHKQTQQEQLDMVMRNIDQYLVQDDENQTAYLKLPAGYAWWYWHGNEIEANAYYLKLLAKTDPKGQRASRLVKYLINNRKHSTYWNSTRDTALCIEAMAEYLKASGEAEPNLELELVINGETKQTVKINKENLFSFDNSFVLEGDAVESGVHTIELHKKGDSPLYWNAYLTNFTKEDFITKAGLEIKVNRKFYKLVEVEQKEAVSGSRGQVINQKVEKYERVELPNLSKVVSGDLIEVELEIDSKNDYEYLLFEDMKAAGFEPVDVRSGYKRDGNGAYVEFRDERVAFFMRQVTRGKSSVSYRLRAEIPGQFSALPTRASAMYAPELKANSDEMKIQIDDRTDIGKSKVTKVN